MSQVVAMGTSIAIVNLAVNDVTDTEFAVPTKNANNLLIRRRGAGDLEIRDADGATDYFTVPENTSITIELQTRKTSVLWIRSVGAPDVAEILVMYE